MKKKSKAYEFIITDFFVIYMDLSAARHTFRYRPNFVKSSFVVLRFYCNSSDSHAFIALNAEPRIVTKFGAPSFCRTFAPRPQPYPYGRKGNFLKFALEKIFEILINEAIRISAQPSHTLLMLHMSNAPQQLDHTEKHFVHYIPSWICIFPLRE